MACFVMVLKFAIQYSDAKLVQLQAAQGLLLSALKILTSVSSVYPTVIVMTGMHVMDLRRAMLQASVLLVPLLTAMTGWLVP